jgi:hypothetical protein
MPVDWCCDSTGGQQAWYVWNTNNSTASTTTVTYSSNVWENWNTGTTTTYGSISTTWTVWVQGAVSAGANVRVVPSWQAPQLSEEERARHEAERAERAKQARIKAEEAARLAEQAKDRARDLLRLLLTEEQWAAYEEAKEFVVTAASGRRYKIVHGYAGNIHLLGDDDGTDERLCIHPSMYIDGGPLPVEDALASQVLMLTADEERFRNVANITPYRRRREQREREQAAA